MGDFRVVPWGGDCEGESREYWKPYFGVCCSRVGSHIAGLQRSHIGSHIGVLPIILVIMGWDVPRIYRPMGHPIGTPYHTRDGMAFDNIGVVVKEANIVDGS